MKQMKNTFYNLIDLIQERLLCEPGALSKGISGPELKQEINLMDKVQTERDAKASIKVLFDMWIHRLNLKESERYQNECKNWKSNLHNTGANSLLRKSDDIHYLMEVWQENIRRGRNN